MDWRYAGVLGSATMMVAAAGLVPSSARAQRVVFVNTDPVVLNADNGQDPTQDSYSTNGFTPGPISGWPALTDEQRSELLYWLREGSLPFDVIYTFDRPAMGSYDMVVMGTDTDNAALFPGLGCSAAVGLADCDDGNAENISFLFYGCMSESDQMDMHRVAFRIFSGLGFGWGLENLTGTGQIMAGYSGTALEFGDTCTTISGTPICPGHLACPAGQQNSTEDLLARIGARVDDGPPIVTITAPGHGMEVGPNITVTATVDDAFGGLAVELELVEAGQTAPGPMPPYAWNLQGVPQGMWTLRVNATDADMNMVSEQVTVCVDLPGCEPPPQSDSTGADGTAGSSTGDEFTTDVFDDPQTTTGGPPSTEPPDTSPTSGAPPSNPTSFGGEPPEAGCQCRASTSPGPWPRRGGLPAALGLLLVLGALTRRE